jgi:hypothetical protein
MMSDRFDDICLIFMVVGMTALLMMLEDEYRKLRTRRLSRPLPQPRLHGIWKARRYIRFR